MADNKIITKINDTDGGSDRIASTFYCTCSTAAGTAQKDATPADSCVFTDSYLVTGVTVSVKFTNTNTHATPTLKVGTATAKQIMKYGTTKPGTTVTTSWQPGSVISFTYDGTYWQMNDHLDDTITTNTDSYISAAGFDWGDTHDEVTMSLTRSGTSPATITANIPRFNDQRGGTVPKGESVSTQSQSTKFLRSDGIWAAPSYTTDNRRHVKVNNTECSLGDNSSNILDLTSDTGVSISAINISGSGREQVSFSVVESELSYASHRESVAPSNSYINVATSTDKTLQSIELAYPGLYLIMASAYFESNSNKSRWIYVNEDESTNAINYYARAACYASDASGTGLNVTFYYYTDIYPITLYLRGKQNSGSTLKTYPRIQYVLLRGAYAD